MDVERMMPETKLGDLTVGDLMDVIGWALTYYRSAQGDDVGGFTARGSQPLLPLLNPRWLTVDSPWWTMSDAGDTGAEHA